MLLRILPDTIPDAWDSIRQAIIPALPPQMRISSTIVGNVLMALLTEEAQLWGFYPDTALTDQNLPKAVIMTTVIEDKVARQAWLLVYSVVALDNATDDEHEEALDCLHDFAGEMKLSGVVAYVNDAGAALWSKYGAAKLSNFIQLR